MENKVIILKAVVKVKICTAERCHKETYNRNILNIRRQIAHKVLLACCHTDFPRKHTEEVSTHLLYLKRIAAILSKAEE